MAPIRILLQTTIPYAENDWHIGRFSMLAEHLASVRDRDGRPVEVTARNLERAGGGSDPVLTSMDGFDQLWLFAVDVGDGLNATECAGIESFRRRGGGVLAARDHQDLGCSLLALSGIGPANYFNTKNPDPSSENCAPDDNETKSILWPNYHSGRNGDVQVVTPVGPIHPLLADPASSRGIIEWLPAHPHEGSVCVPPGDASGRVIAKGKSQITNRPFNLMVVHDPAAKNGAREGRWIAESSFHHFADYNWDTRKGAPTFVSEPPGDQIAKNPGLLEGVHAYTQNVALWLSALQP